MHQTLSIYRPIAIGLVFCCWLGLSGCSSIANSVGSSVGDGFNQALLNAEDPQLVEQALPAYVLMLDSLLQKRPDSPALLLAAAKLNNAYGTLFVREPQRQRFYSQKAFDYASRALCQIDERDCALGEMAFEAFSQRIQMMEADQVANYYGLASAWAAWIQARQDDWKAVAQLARVEAIMQQVVALDPSHDQGNAYLYLGVFATLVPAHLGGKPEQGQEHFLQAIQLSGEQNLLAKVFYAQYYARLVFDQGLHDRLLREVLIAEPQAPGFSLSNNHAQNLARELLRTGQDYF